jgi:xanthine dehydrogenase accessory factor
MYELTESVLHWHAEGRLVWLVRLIETRGFSSRLRVPIVAWTNGEPPIGELLSASSDLDLFAELFAELAHETEGTCRVVEVSIADERASGAGLSCGGTARLLVEPAGDYPSEMWARLDRREPLCLVTELRGEQCASTDVFTQDTVTEVRQRTVDGALPHWGVDLPRLFARGTSEVTLLREGEFTTVVQVLWPVPELVVVGDGLIAAALFDVAQRLGWHPRVAADATSAQASRLTESDAIVVLSHDRDIDGPALQAALAGRAGYVGGLGSRRTQSVRSAWLDEHGVSPESVRRIHGPAGLDIGAHTAEEIAISIIAEIIGSRSAATGGSLAARSGPVHLSGVGAPPAR